MKRIFLILIWFSLIIIVAIFDSKMKIDLTGLQRIHDLIWACIGLIIWLIVDLKKGGINELLHIWSWSNWK